MPVGITQIHHIQIFVPREMEEQAKHFYGELLGLEEIPKPEPYRKNGGAWYRFGGNQLHMSLMRKPEDNLGSLRHVCYMVSNVAVAEKIMREAGVEIIPDDRPFVGWTRFYVRDPGGNYIEIAEMNKPEW